MNPLPPNADELVSAYLDGEAAPDEIALVESNAKLMARVESLRALTTPLGEPVTPPAEQKEAHLAAALGAFDAMFAEASGETTKSSPTSPLAAAPDPPTAVSDAPVKAKPDVVESETVRSLDAARERREQRRFSPTVIAAALAALLMVVVVSVLSFGGGRTDDVANSSLSDAAEAVDFASDASDDAADAMTEAASAETDRAAGGLSEVETQQVAPSPTVNALQAPSAAAPAEEAMEDEAAEDDAMDDEEEAMDDEEAMSDSDAAEEAGDEAALDGDLELVLGDFPTVDALLAELETFPISELTERRDIFGEGLFVGCVAEISGLTSDTESLVGAALVGETAVDIHIQVQDDDATTLYIVDRDACESLATTTIP